MRIIDKNTDFYDYYQNIYPDDSLTFDRTDSFLLTKEMMCKYLGIYYHQYLRYNKHSYVLLQICNTFWLFHIEITEKDNYGCPKDYNVKLLSTWKNYNLKRKLISLDVIFFGIEPYQIFRKTNNIYNEKRINSLVQMINTKDYKILKSINEYTIYIGNDKFKKHIPLLKASGLASCINPLDAFLAFEEYFSLEKSSSERREPIGTTDINKIESHGFDVKSSFRGKR